MSLINNYSIKYQSRPIKIAYLVKDAVDAVRAGEFLSCVWGGNGSIILPIGRNKKSIQEMKGALLRHEPDVVIHHKSQISAAIELVLNELPAILLPLEQKEISMFIEGNSFIRFYGSRLINHLTTIDNLDDLYSVCKDRMIEKVLEYQGSKNDSSSASKIELYERLLLQVVQIKTNANAQNHIRRGISVSMADMFVDSDSFLYIYLVDGGISDVYSLAGLWNDSIIWQQNKFLLPKDEFFRYAHETLTIIKQCLPRFQYLRIVVRCRKREAVEYHRLLSEEINNSELGLTVDVVYDGHISHAGANHPTYGQNEYQSYRDTELTGYVPLQCSVPEIFHGTDHAYAVEATINRNGQEVALPYDKESGDILTLGSEWLERIQFKPERFSAQNIVKVRSTRRGFAFIYSEMNREKKKNNAGIWLEADKTVIAAYFKYRGLTLKENPAGQYASIVANRIAKYSSSENRILDLNIARSLIKSAKNKTSIYPLTFAKVIGNYNEIYNDKLNDSRIKSGLKVLVKAGLVHVGVVTQCEYCSYEDWYSLKDHGEIVECTCCSEQTVISIDRMFSYRASELLLKLNDHGGYAVVNAYFVLKNHHEGMFLNIGSEVVRASESKPFCDLDIVQFRSTGLVTIECKDYYTLEIELLRKDLAKAVRSAIAVNAKTAILYVRTPKTIEDNILIEIQDLCLSEQELQFYIIINDDIYIPHPKAKNTKVEVRKYSSIKTYYQSSADNIVGKYHRNHGIGGFEKYFDLVKISELVKTDLS